MPQLTTTSPGPYSFPTALTLDNLRQITPRTRTHSALLGAATRQAALLRESAAPQSQRFDFNTLAALADVEIDHESGVPVPATGYRTPDGRTWRISVNQDIAEDAQRFAALHVLKHIIDEPMADSLYGGTRSATAPVRDAMADRFADEVLVPVRLLSLKSNIRRSVAELSEIFTAPAECIQRQLMAANLDIALKSPREAAAPRLLTVVEAATALRVSRWTIYELIKSGELRPVRIRARTLFASEEIERYLAALREAHNG